MAEINVMSWNIESFSEKDLNILHINRQVSFSNFIAHLVHEKGVDLLLVMEVSTHSATEISRSITDALNEMQRRNINPNRKMPQIWISFSSDPTGKDFELPSVIDPTELDKKKLDSASYWDVLKTCYEEENVQLGKKRKHMEWKLKDSNSYNEIDKDFCITALLNAGLLRQDREGYLVFFRCDGNPDNAAPSEYWNDDAMLGLVQKRSHLVYTDELDKRLGYQDPKSTFNGRCPYLVQLYTKKGNNNADYLPLILFHAPFGSGVNLRIQANNELLNLGVYAGPDKPMPSGKLSKVQMKNAPVGLICADFNVNFNGETVKPTLPLTNKASDSTRTYGYFIAKDFLPTVNLQNNPTEPDVIKSTLVTKEKAQKSWTKPTKYRSSAYDNIVLKATPTNVKINESGIVDLVSNLTDATLAYKLIGCTFNSKNNVYDAFRFYREKVSDHLPAILKLTLT